jgi:hypothetical protein
VGCPAPEGCQRYTSLLNPILDAIDLTRGVLRGILLVEARMEAYLNNDPQVIQVRSAVQEKEKSSIFRVDTCGLLIRSIV